MIYYFQDSIFDEFPNLGRVGNRAFAYGDGFFETMYATGTLPRFFDYHYARMEQAAAVFRLPGLPSKQHLAQAIEATLQHRVVPIAKVKIYVWRHASGTFRADPNGGQACYLIETQSAQPSYTPIAQMGICNTVVKSQQPWSFAKPLSAMEYVMAGQYANQQGFDDALLVNGQGQLVEAIAANVFFLIKGQWVTPPLSSGCVAGVMRRVVLSHYASHIKAKEQHLCPSQLPQVQACFTTNAAGIRWVQAINHHRLQILIPETEILFAKLNF